MYKVRHLPFALFTYKAEINRAGTYFCARADVNNQGIEGSVLWATKIWIIRANRSDKGLTLESSASKFLFGANLPYHFG